MSVAFYMDHHVPRAITEGLRRRGVDVLTALEDQADKLEDEVLLERATSLGRTLFSQDRDHLRAANAWLKASRSFSGLVYGHQLRVTIGQAIRDLHLIGSVLYPEDMRNRIEFLPL